MTKEIQHPYRWWGGGLSSVPGERSTAISSPARPSQGGSPRRYTSCASHRCIAAKAGDRGHRREIEGLVKRIEKVETALEARFQEHFVNAMALPNKVEPFPELAKAVDLPAVAAGDGDGGDGAPRRRRRRAKG